jgi:cell division protein ZapA (FtsZ GTPase activity inhibitor)
LGQHVTIELFGRSYNLQAESDTVSTENAADTLVGEVEKVETQHAGVQPGLSRLDVLILAAMNIAHENVKLKKKQSLLLRDVSDRSADLIERLDRCLTQQLSPPGR